MAAPARQFQIEFKCFVSASFSIVSAPFSIVSVSFSIENDAETIENGAETMEKDVVCGGKPEHPIGIIVRDFFSLPP